MKVEIMRSDNRFDLEKEINRFIIDKKVVNVSLAIGKAGYDHFYVATILYEI
jgi:hypothetical protein